MTSFTMLSAFGAGSVLMTAALAATALPPTASATPSSVKPPFLSLRSSDALGLAQRANSLSLKMSQHISLPPGLSATPPVALSAQR